MHYQKNLALAQIIQENPILRYGDSAERAEYFRILMEYLRRTRWKSRWVKAEIELYRSMLDVHVNENMQEKIIKDEIYLFLLADIAAVAGYQPKLMTSDGGRKVLYLLRKRNRGCTEKDFELVAKAVWGRDKNAWKKVWKMQFSNELNGYFELIKRNQDFSEKEPVRIFVTAMMSAGKSTFINALSGNRLCWSQNAACTSKIHTIIGKPFEDCFFYEDDHILRLNASKEILFDDDVRNKENKIIVSSYLNSTLAGERIEIYDSPGVNSSMNVEHKEITEDIVKKRRFDMYIYLMNATQLMTDDEAEYLNFIKENVDKKKIVFVINKIDRLDNENENLNNIKKDVKEFLVSTGFEKPLVYAVSAEAALRGRCFMEEGLQERERRKLEFMLDDLFTLQQKREELNYEEYEKNEICLFDDLIKASGIISIENLIKSLKKER